MVDPSLIEHNIFPSPDAPPPSSLEAILSIYQTLKQVLQKHPSKFGTDISKKTLRFLFTCSENFCIHRSTRHVSRIIGTLYFFEKALLKRVEVAPKARHLLFRILKTPLFDPSDGKRALGLVISANLKEGSEFFDKSHILKCIHRILPGIKEIPSSFYTYRDCEHPIVFHYLEFKKTRGVGFSSREIKRLKEQLSQDLKESIEYLSPSLFIPRNDEEIFRNIIQMSRELKYAHDLPQVMISFQKQTGNSLSFTVIVVRLLKKSSSPLQEISYLLPRSIRFVPLQVSQLGLLKKKYPKEGSVFSLEIENSLFLRNDSSIDLRRARHYLAKALKLMLGDFRDYNGGFLSKQNEQLELIKESLGDEGKNHVYLMETLFYSLNPSLIQTLLTPEAGKAYLLLFLEAMKTEIPKNRPCLFLKNISRAYVVIIIKTRLTNLEELIHEELQTLPHNSYQYGHSIHQIEEDIYHCFLYQYPYDEKWAELFEKKISSISSTDKMKRRTDHVLKINFQDGDPPSLNPHIGIDLRCRSLQKALFEGLVRISPNGIPEPAAAEKIEISACKTYYLFKLRPHQWSNGEKVTAHHFEYSWKRAIHSSSPCLRPDLFFTIQNAKKIHLETLPIDTMGVKALDEKTLEVKLEYPSPYFLELLAHPIFSPLYGEAEEPTVFNGPFILQSWVRDRYLSLAPNSYYWDAERIKLRGVDVSIVRDPQEALHMYENKQIDWIGDPFSVLPLPILVSLGDSKKLKKAEATGISWIYCNTHYYPLSSSKIRKALSFAIDRNTLCKEVLVGQTPHKSPLPRTMSSLKESELYKDGDVPAASELFHEGLKELGLSKKTFPPLIFLHSHIAGQKEWAEAIKNQWEKAFGIVVKPKQVDWNTLSSIFDRREYQIGGCFRHFFFQDPLYVFNLFKDSANVHNASSWNHSYFQEVVNTANKATSLQERTSLLRKAELILLDEMPVIPTHMTTNHYMAREDLKGIHICQSGDVDFKWIYFE